MNFERRFALLSALFYCIESDINVSLNVFTHHGVFTWSVTWNSSFADDADSTYTTNERSDSPFQSTDERRSLWLPQSTSGSSPNFFKDKFRVAADNDDGAAVDGRAEVIFDASSLTAAKVAFIMPSSSITEIDVGLRRGLGTAGFTVTD